MQRDIWTRLKSRKFLSAVVYTIVVFVAEVLEMSIAYEIYYVTAGILGLFIMGESAIDYNNKDVK